MYIYTKDTFPFHLYILYILCVYVVMSIIEATAKLATHKECYSSHICSRHKIMHLRKLSAVPFSTLLLEFLLSGNRKYSREIE